MSGKRLAGKNKRLSPDSTRMQLERTSARDLDPWSGRRSDRGIARSNGGNGELHRSSSVSSVAPCDLCRSAMARGSETPQPAAKGSSKGAGISSNSPARSCAVGDWPNIWYQVRVRWAESEKPDACAAAD